MPPTSSHSLNRVSRVRWASLTIVALGLSLLAMTPSPVRAAETCSPNSASTDSCTAPKSRSDFEPRRLIGTMPALSGENLVGTEAFDVTALKGTPVAVVFWLNTCPHCQAVMPKVNKFGENVDSDAVVVAAAIDAGLRGDKGYETPAAATKTMHLTIPTVLVSSAAADEWQVAQTPTGFVLDSSGTVTAVIVGETPKAFVKKLGKFLAAAS
jgi:thiol-disulfide isomerase/thioredoxin